MSLRMRRGGAVSAPPPSSEVFGPTNGSQPVRNGARPNVILDAQKPAGAINVSPGSFTQALCNSSGVGAKFWLLAGTHTVTGGIQPLTNQQIWCQNGAIIDGGNSASLFLVAGGNGGIHIHGGTWQHQGNSSSSSSAAAILATGNTAVGGWVIEDVTVINNFNKGIMIGQPNCTVRRFKSNSNGRYGISSAQTNDGTMQQGATIEYGEIASNNTRHLPTGDDASGTKFLYTNGGTYRYLWAHDNDGFGLWWDGPNQGHTISENVIENNGGGLFYEIGSGGTVIAHNYISGNGNSADNNYPFNAVQLTVSCAPADGSLVGSGFETNPVASVRAEVNNNDVDASGFASAIVLYNHGVHATAKRSRNWYVHHNRMWQRAASGVTGRCGLCDACSPAHPNSPSKVGDIGTSPGLPALDLFDYNEYHVADSSGSYWEHDTGYLTPGARTFLGFQSRGHEAHGTVVQI